MTDSVERLLGVPGDAIVAWVRGTGGTCPRCGTPLAMRDPVEANALSRWARGEDDPPLYICSPCGTSEAFQDWVGILDHPSTWTHPPTTTGANTPAT